MPAPPSKPRPRAANRILDRRHRVIRRQWEPAVLAGGVRCARCGGLIEPGEPWDLGHVDGDRSRYAGPEHAACNRRTAGKRLPQIAVVGEPEPERDGIPYDDPRWRVPWLAELLDVPADASWPRLMTAPHPRAVDSLGAEFVVWAQAREGRALRWWQRLAATRMLEVDEAGRLLWENVLLTMTRQVGKSWLLRELCLWRIHQAERFGEAQDVLHTGKDLKVCIEVQRPARQWAKRDQSYRVREANGQVEIELIATGSRWMLFAKEAVYGFSGGFAAVDEGWKVRPEVIEEGVEPTLVEREQPQILLVSTAHRMATSLMLGRRAAAVERLDDDDATLLVEWSAPRGADIDDPATWRAASAHWSDRRARVIARQLARARAGTLRADDEPDPIEAFIAQWLNQWPREVLTAKGSIEELLGEGVWDSLAEPGLESDGPIWVAVEDNFGEGAAVAAVARLADGRLEADGWTFRDWDTAIAYVRALGAGRRIRHLQVGASVLAKAPTDLRPAPAAAGAAETRVGLALLRDLAAGGEIAHDSDGEDLAAAVSLALVKEAPSGLVLITDRGHPHLVRALVWALAAAHRRPRVMQIG